jgi:poly-gamma-glutamate synthesis protein (capsule biosynthesis protein)
VACAGFSDTTSLSLLAFGDVNLGRAVGQELLKGNLDYPFAECKHLIESADIVFVNLESQLSDQGGITQHPKYNLIFSGPPEGAEALRRAGITVVSTANNHAFDYGMKGVGETIDFLVGAGIRYVGTSKDSTRLFPSVIIQKNGIRVGFVAYTEFVNMKRGWDGRIATFDDAKAREEIERLRPNVDVIVASYHGGDEYVDRPKKATLRNLRFLADAGANLVIGHHPHVPQGIERYNGKLIAHSLGNFVFYQPQKYWTQRGIGLLARVEKTALTARIADVRILPVSAGKQPSFLSSELERKLLFDRLRKLSNVSLQQETEWFQIVPMD